MIVQRCQGEWWAGPQGTPALAGWMGEGHRGTPSISRNRHSRHISAITPSHPHTSTEGLMVEDPRATAERTSGWRVHTSPPCLISIQEQPTGSLSRACTSASSAQCWQKAASTCTLKEGICTRCRGHGFQAAPGSSRRLCPHLRLGGAGSEQQLNCAVRTPKPLNLVFL